MIKTLMTTKTSKLLCFLSHFVFKVICLQNISYTQRWIQHSVVQNVQRVSLDYCCLTRPHAYLHTQQSALKFSQLTAMDRIQILSLLFYMQDFGVKNGPSFPEKSESLPLQQNRSKWMIINGYGKISLCFLMFLNLTFMDNKTDKTCTISTDAKIVIG